LDCVLTLLAPPLVDGALGLRLALLRIDEDPALRAAAIRRQHAARALPLLQRRHALRMRLGQNLLGLGQGRWDPGDPLDAGIGKLLQIVGAIEGTVGHKLGGAIGGLERCHVLTDNLAKHVAIATIAAQGLHQHRDTGLGLHDQL
jgi:hypothetical protein